VVFIPNLSFASTPCLLELQYRDHNTDETSIHDVCHLQTNATIDTRFHLKTTIYINRLRNRPSPT
jgi:hypothetical protein